MSIFRKLFYSFRKPKFDIVVTHTGSVTGPGKVVPAATLPGYPEKDVSIVSVEGTLHVDEGEFSVRGGCRIRVKEGAKLELGNGFMFRGCKIACTNHISIGRGSVIGAFVTLDDSNGPIVIGENVWIGRSVSIHKGVTIGDGANIPEGMAVTESLPARYGRGTLSKIPQGQAA